jgi:hypothetical protein
MLADGFQRGLTHLAPAKIIERQWSEEATQVVRGHVEVGVDILRQLRLVTDTATQGAAIHPALEVWILAQILFAFRKPTRMSRHRVPDLLPNARVQLQASHIIAAAGRYRKSLGILHHFRGH